ncbi:MAG: hypothetical protein IJM59_05715, partial [Proteobacteria bacterium]|nr:hypothetical protein [Pseudomonadota bacterium]
LPLPTPNQKWSISHQRHDPNVAVFKKNAGLVICKLLNLLNNLNWHASFLYSRTDRFRSPFGVAIMKNAELQLLVLVLIIFGVGWFIPSLLGA